MNLTTKHSIIDGISCILNGVVEKESLLDHPHRITVFTSQSIPSTPLSTYMERILKYSNCSAECLVFSLIYIDRLIQNGIVPVDALSIHRIVLASTLVAIKFNDDRMYSNSFYAQIGGITSEELNILEIEFLKAINFSLLVPCEDYTLYYNELVSRIKCAVCDGTEPIPIIIRDVIHPGYLCYSCDNYNISSPCNYIQTRELD